VNESQMLGWLVGGYKKQIETNGFWNVLLEQLLRVCVLWHRWSVGWWEVTGGSLFVIAVRWAASETV